MATIEQVVAAWHAICQQVPTDNTNVRELMSPLGSPRRARAGETLIILVDRIMCKPSLAIHHWRPIISFFILLAY